MNKTVLITGASSGIGKAAARYFAEQGWNVAATMRSPEKENDFKMLTNVNLYALDVTRNESIAEAFKQILQDFGKIDVVVNNAGFGVDGVFEEMSDEVIQKQFDTNVFGLMRMTREAIKLMRSQGGGHIVQIASMGGRLAFPLYSIYHSTKWAVEGFSESLHYELLHLNIRIKIIEPGNIKTEFTGRSRHFVKPEKTDAYDAFVAQSDKITMDFAKGGEDPKKVAAVIFKAANDQGNGLRYTVGAPAPLLMFLRKLLPLSWYIRIVKIIYKI